MVEPAHPVFVDVRPPQYSHPNKCTFNVKEAIHREGGEIIYGWSIAVWPKVMMDCIGHAVHDIDGHWKCVTPEKDDNTKILFLPDPSMTFDFDDPQARMPHRYIPLNPDPLIARLIELENRDIEIRSRYTRTSGELVIVGTDAAALQQIQREKIELLRRIFLRTKHHNEPCVCGSGRKFRKCCRPDMLAVGPA